MAKIKIVRLNNDIEDAITFIIENPCQDVYISNNIQYFMNYGEADDNSIKLGDEWEDNLNIVFDFLKKIINYKDNGKD